MSRSDSQERDSVIECASVVGAARVLDSPQSEMSAGSLGPRLTEVAGNQAEVWGHASCGIRMMVGLSASSVGTGVGVLLQVVVEKVWATCKLTKLYMSSAALA